ncbi:MAG: helix-hairpin-helix domain-containing protein [Halobacteriales archaeon]|nr:helix-hairpin-helix domain-containing protein [Halobacteriales archaeon]
MGLLDTIKSVLGLGSGRDTEPQPDASSEYTVQSPASEQKEDDEAIAHKEGSAGITEEPPGDGMTEPAEATEVTDHAGTETSAAESAEAAGPVPEEPEDGNLHVESINGIGPAYAKRLEEAGIESVAELADADAEWLADETGISAKRLSDWIDRAGEQ